MNKPRMLWLDPDANKNVEQMKTLNRDRFEITVVDYFTRECIKHGEIGVLVRPEMFAKNPPALVIINFSLLLSGEGQIDDWLGLDLLANVRKRMPQTAVISVSRRINGGSDWGKILSAVGRPLLTTTWNYLNDADERIFSRLLDTVVRADWLKNLSAFFIV